MIESSAVTPSVREQSEPRRDRRRSRSVGRYRSTAALGSALTSPTEFNARDDDDDEDEGGGGGGTDAETTSNFIRMSRRRKFTVLTFCTANFFIGIFYSILAPFFPMEAASKGVSSSTVGFIFGSFELVLVLVSPICGSFMSQVGAKFMFVSGMFASGTCAILFGFLDKVNNDWQEYVVLCFVVRIFEALGAAAFGTASFAIMAFNFPKHIATMFGTLETLTGIGLMVGPPLGGILYEFGGFILPFAVTGSLLLCVALLSLFLLPSQKVTSLPHEGSIFSLLRIPIVVITGFCLIMGSSCLGFLDVTLSPFLMEKFVLSPMLVGFVFLVEPVGYAVMSPLWGRIVNNRPNVGQLFIVGGYILAGLSFYFIGPAPFFGFEPNLGVVIVCLVFNGLGISTLAITFQIITDATLAGGNPDSLATYGLIAGVVNSFFSIGLWLMLVLYCIVLHCIVFLFLLFIILGCLLLLLLFFCPTRAFIGPIGGGFLKDQFGFAMAGVFVGSFTILSALLLFVYTFLARSPTSSSKEEEQERLSLLVSSESKNSGNDLILT